MNSLVLTKIEKEHLGTISELDSDTKAANGQFMTPVVIARAMAEFFDTPSNVPIRLLDPGAGTGALTFAFLEMLMRRGYKSSSVQVVAVEQDCKLAKKLKRNASFAIREYETTNWNLDIKIINDDFISSTVRTLKPQLGEGGDQFNRFTHVIMNPPYLKLSASSNERMLLDSVGMPVNNLYSAFMALSMALLEEGGHMVAITPRSFCNGPYFRPFRKRLLNQASFRRIHVFGRRDSAFKEDDVLQENIISYLEKMPARDVVRISKTADRSFKESSIRLVPSSQIVNPLDPDLIIRIPANTHDDYVLERMSQFSNRIKSIGLDVSTGPVVDFRVKEHIQIGISEDAVPLIYSAHFRDQSIDWPLVNGKKPNAIRINAATNKWLLPNGNFTLIKRFSSKEERRRIYPACYFPIKTFEKIGFENHLNVIHSKHSGIDETLSRGIVSYLSSTIVDLYFRQFSGHTQVNASDLRTMPFPSLELLYEMAQFHNGSSVRTDEVDAYLEAMFRNHFGISTPDPVVVSRN